MLRESTRAKLYALLRSKVEPLERFPRSKLNGILSNEEIGLVRFALVFIILIVAYWVYHHIV